MHNEFKMKAQNISQLTLEELTALITKLVDERISQVQHPLQAIDQEHLKKLFRSIDNHMWTPPADAPSTLELLRQDRDR
ncbi:hypothetical protein [Gloeothece verrucosa]|uniref:Uncharacterized protein n=1 Tax=Gloeothece verrucosa (strain PCC 7822) TaxID=497965 RepID=E0UBV9_GLOV7|nr:hypothetical protein [Gloeothece verrucosa]ADN15174.1 hypothetical protein Cyan7822_3222 [Gloeothece verrucosa PCC 7822]